MTTILDPTDERVPVERQITPRTGSIPGVIGLLDISKPRGNVLLDELQSQLAALMLPATGVASAIDLGDSTSPYGNVHVSVVCVRVWWWCVHVRA
jgi:hypothetical protein